MERKKLRFIRGFFFARYYFQDHPNPDRTDYYEKTRHFYNSIFPFVQRCGTGTLHVFS